MDNGGNILVLVDAYAQIYRAFFAIRNLTDASGNPTNAVYGVARFLFALDRAYPHDYGAFVFDKGRPQERIELLPEYKANRPAMPDPMRAQLADIREWIEAFGFPIFEKEGFEADDIIAGLVGVALGVRTLIVSHDKDLGQLVTDPDVAMLVPAKGGLFTEMGEAEVEAKFGVPPPLVRDWLALVGDSSDNIPGVPGVGAKTATELLRQFGSLDDILRRRDEIRKSRIRQSVVDHARRLKDNLRLVALNPSLPEGWGGLETARRRQPDWDKLEAMSRDYGFKTIVKTIHEQRDRFRNPTLF